MKRERSMFRGMPSWAKAVIAVVMSGVILLGFGTLMMEKNKSVNMLEGVYERSFYDLISEVNDMEIKLDKLSVSNSTKYQRELLGELVVTSELASVRVSELSQGEVSMESTSRYINQLGDYAKSLQKKVDAGTPLSQEDKRSLDNLREVSAGVGRKLALMRDKIGNDYDFTVNTDGVGKDFSEIDVSIDYPELIYDGPFSDSVVNAEPKGISDRRVEDSEAYNIARRAIDIEIDGLEYVGEWTGKITTLNYMSGDTTVKLALDGSLLLYDTPSSVGGDNYSEEECVRIAEEYLKRVGFKSLIPVWYSNYSGNIFINFVHTQDDVIYYSDMVKVKVSGDTGKVVAFEGMSYMYNHVDRVSKTPTITSDEARSKAETIDVEKVRLASIPVGSGEVLSWEVFGSVGEKKYFIYIDAMTGEEINILSVIDSEQGDLLM